MFTRQHFEAIAAVFRDAEKSEIEQTPRALVASLRAEFADIFAESNPRFDRARFMRAAGAGQ